MKKYFLICIFLCGVVSVVSAQQQKKKSATIKQKHSKTVKGKKKGTTLRAKKSAKKSAWKKSTTKRSKRNKYGKTASFAKLNLSSHKTAAWNTGLPVEMNPEDILYGKGLANNRGKLPWPVDGIVSIPYGDYKIEGTRIMGNNPGITIATSDKDVPVKAVYDGVVSGIDDHGEVSSIYIKHGKYYTVYSNVSAIHVSKGEVVKGGEIIGNVGEAYATSGGELNFLVMDDRNNVDPSRWLSHQ